MPLHQAPISSRLSQCELIPFLAPRVFKPWPNDIRTPRTHYLLPFLAPRVFKPWPNYIRTPRTHELPPFLAPRVFKPRPKYIRTPRTHGSVQETASQVVSEKECGERIHKERSASEPEAQRRQIRWVETDPLPRILRGRRPILTVDNIRKPILRRVGYYEYYPDIRRILLAAEEFLPRVREKFIKVAISGASSSRVPIASSWSAPFAKLSWKYDENLKACQPPLELRTLLDNQISKYLESVERFVHLRTYEDMLKKWPDLALQEKEAVWPIIMLRKLEWNPSSALEFLVATASTFCPPSYAISDSLQYIACHHLFEKPNPDSRDALTIFQAILGLLHNFEQNYFHLTQKTIYWLLINLEVDDAWLFYTRLNQTRHPLHADTLLHFAERFANAGRTQLAVDVLGDIIGYGTDFDQPKLQSLCTTLLQRIQPSNHKSIPSDSEVFALLLNLGLQPNIQIYTTLVKNAIDDEDPETAWRIHDIMLESKVRPNEYTYSILLNDAKLRMDWPTVERIMKIMRSDKIADEELVTDFLHALFLHFEQERKMTPTGNSPPSPFPRMLALYGEYFDPGPMKELLGASIYQKYVRESDGRKIRPSKYTLTVMFIAMVRGFSSSQLTWKWYCHFRELLMKRHPDAIALVTSTRLYDAVIMSLGNASSTMQLCTIVVRDMLDSYEKAQKAIVSPREALASYSDTSSAEHIGRVANSSQDFPLHDSITKHPTPSFNEKIPDAWLGGGYDLRKSENDLNLQVDLAFAHCQPSIRTWSILLNIFMNHDQPHAAEKVIEMMRTRGIEPNQVSWNSLALGYGRMQDIPGIVRTISRLEKENLVLDHVTMRALRLVRNRNALISAIQAKDALLCRSANPTEMKEVQALTEDVSQMIEMAARHFPEEEKPMKVSTEPHKPLECGPNDISFPTGENQSEVALECLRDMNNEEEPFVDEERKRTKPYQGQ